jgi:hypothetical protein
VAAHAYRLLAGRTFDVAVLVGPYDFVGFDGVSIVLVRRLRDALGVSPIDAFARNPFASARPSSASIPTAHAANTRSRCSCVHSAACPPALPIVRW